MCWARSSTTDTSYRPPRTQAAVQRPRPPARASSEQGAAVDHDLLQRRARHRLAMHHRPTGHRRRPARPRGDLEGPLAHRHEVLHARSSDGDGLHVRRLRKEVEGPRVREPVPAPEPREVACEGGRIAGRRTTSRARPVRGDGVHHARLHAGARRVGQHQLRRLQPVERRPPPRVASRRRPRRSARLGDLHRVPVRTRRSRRWPPAPPAAAVVSPMPA